MDQAERPAAAVLTVPCPFCEARPGEHCINIGGYRTIGGRPTDAHDARRLAALGAGKVPLFRQPPWLWKTV